MRYFLAFLAGFLSTLTFHQAFIALLHRAGQWPRPAWPMDPTPPLQVPAVLSLAFWGGLWALALAPVLARWGLGPSYWVAWFVAGAILPTLVALFVVMPLKGKPPAGGWDPKVMVGAMMVNGVWGLGTALFLRLFARFWP
jgi:hypothetical protein